MPTKRIVKQKQKQRQKQSVVVNVNLAKEKARAKSSAKKSGRKGSRALMLPPPIYASPIDRLTPAMYGAQGQQIQQRSMEEVFRNFLSNQQKQNAPISTPNRLGSSRGASFPDNVSDITDLDFEWDRYNDLINIGENMKRDEIQDLKGSQLRDQFNKFKNEIQIPFQREERTYLKASEPDYEINEPKSFSQNQARVSQGNIYESSRRPNTRPPQKLQIEEESSVETSRPNPLIQQVSEESYVNVGGGEPKIFRPRKPRQLGDYQVVGEEEVISENPFPETMYNKMMGI